MGVAMGADSVGGVEPVLLVAVKGISLLAMVEANNIAAPQVGGGANLYPARRVWLCMGDVTEFMQAGLGLGKPAFDVIPRILDLPEYGGNDLTPGGKETRIRHRAVVLHHGMQVVESVVGNQREHVMLHV